MFFYDVCVLHYFKSIKQGFPQTHDKILLFSLVFIFFLLDGNTSLLENLVAINLND